MKTNQNQLLKLLSKWYMLFKWLKYFQTFNPWATSTMILQGDAYALSVFFLKRKTKTKACPWLQERLKLNLETEHPCMHFHAWTMLLFMTLLYPQQKACLPMMKDWCFTSLIFFRFCRHRCGRTELTAHTGANGRICYNFKLAKNDVWRTCSFTFLIFFFSFQCWYFLW